MVAAVGDRQFCSNAEFVFEISVHEIF